MGKLHNTVHKCKVCDTEYTREEVTRKYGADFPFGYCCPRCYTVDKIEKGEGIE